MSATILQRLQAEFGPAVLAAHAHRGDDTALIEPARLLDIARFLRDDPALQLDMLIDVTCLDTLGFDARQSGRFELVYHFRSSTYGHRVRIKAAIDEGPNEENPEIDSLMPLWKGANWFEREVWDMFGVRFRGHPDLRRILLYEEFVGYPLRKDYPKDRRQPLVRRDFS